MFTGHFSILSPLEDVCIAFFIPLLSQRLNSSPRRQPGRLSNHFSEIFTIFHRLLDQ